MIRKSVVLACGPDRAFALFTEEASEWWPVARRHTSDPQSRIEMLATGRFWERAADGHEVELGKVLVWLPGKRLELDFYPGTDVEHPTRVVVSFVAEGQATRVTVDHGPTEVSAALWKDRAPRFERSWELLLEALSAAADPS
jgi:hypothetical protein